MFDFKNKYNLQPTDQYSLTNQSHCGYTTTTSSDTFTVYNQLLDRCTAKKFCQKNILAPKTSKKDKDVVTNLFHPWCKIHQGTRRYHLGLD